MSRSRARTSALAAAALFLAAACSSTGTGASRAPSAVPTAAPTAVPTTAPTPPLTAAPSADASGDTGDPARVGDWTAMEPCDLLTEEAVTTVVGGLRGAPVRGDAAGGGRSCTWTDEGGGTVTISTADPSSFASMRASASGAEDVPGLGSGAYVVTEGETARLVVHGGAVILVIDASEGREVSEAAARAVLAVLEVL